MDEKQIDSYLYAEMSDEERAQIEDRFISDDELFAEIAGRENDLVDAYVRGKLTDTDRERFERSLEKLPARKEKIANAGLLREFINIEREDAKTITIAERSSYFSSLAQMISFRSPAMQFASVALILLLGLVSVFLLRENRRLGSLDAELAAARQREGELVADIEDQREATGDLASDLKAERERIATLEAELAKLKDGGSSAKPPTPTIATLILTTAGIRGEPVAARLEIPKNATRVVMTIEIPSEEQSLDRVSVRINGNVVAANVRVRNIATDQTSMAVLSVIKSRFRSGANQVEVLDPSGRLIQTYAVALIEDK